MIEITTGNPTGQTRGFHITQEADDKWACQIVDQRPIDAIYALVTMLEATSRTISNHMNGGCSECIEETRQALAIHRRMTFLQYKYLDAKDSVHVSRFHIEELHALLTILLARAEEAERANDDHVEPGGEIG